MKKILFSEKQINDIIHKYKVENYSQKNIGEIYGVSKNVIARILKENNIPSKDNSKEIPEEIVEQILDRYVNEHYGLQSAGAPWGYGQKVVETLLKKANITKRSYIESKQITRLYSLNDDFFKEQNSNMAYILGFLASDGNVSSSENSINIQLQRADEQILKDIKEIVQSNRPLDYYTTVAGRETVKFQVWSSSWKNDLSLYGIIPNKTFNLQPPNYLKKEYRIDYIRGYFDGDGSIWWKENNFHQCYWDIVGASNSVINWIYQTLVNDYGIINSFGINNFYTSNDVKMYKISYYGFEKIKLLYSALYYDDNVLCLKRKKEKMETILK